LRKSWLSTHATLLTFCGCSNSPVNGMVLSYALKTWAAYVVPG
jgi:hypothetical protein